MTEAAIRVQDVPLLLRQAGGPPRHQLRGGPRRDPRVPRPQRGGQVHHHQDPHRAAAPRDWPGPGARHGRDGRRPRRPGPDRGLFRREKPVRVDVGAGEPALLRPAVRHPRRRRRWPAPQGGLGRPGPGPGRQVLQGDAPAPDDGPGPGQHPPGALPRRAHRRPGPGVLAGHPHPHQAGGRAGGGGAADHPRYVRGRRALRPGGLHQRGAHPRRRYPGEPEAEAWAAGGEGAGAGGGRGERAVECRSTPPTPGRGSERPSATPAS